MLTSRKIKRYGRCNRGARSPIPVLQRRIDSGRPPSRDWIRSSRKLPTIPAVEFRHRVKKSRVTDPIPSRARWISRPYRPALKPGFSSH